MDPKLTNSEWVDFHTHVLGHLQVAAENRGPDPDVWIPHERAVVADAANQWAQRHGLTGRITVGDIERIEHRAIGHSDYAQKLAYAACEHIYRP